MRRRNMLFRLPPLSIVISRPLVLLTNRHSPCSRWATIYRWRSLKPNAKPIGKPPRMRSPVSTTQRDEPACRANRVSLRQATTVRIARSFDLSVVGQENPNETNDNLVIEGALFDSGRPVLVIPYIQSAGLNLAHVTICWDGSRSAARAVNDAMPFLAKAKAIDVVTVSGEKDKPEPLQNVDIAQHLARHGLAVELRTIVGGNLDVANALLSDAADRATGLFVMGGYGHSRLREFILGGATRGILQSMTVPTFMSH